MGINKTLLQGRNELGGNYTLLAYLLVLTIFTKILEEQVELFGFTLDPYAITIWLIGIGLLLVKRKVGKLEARVFAIVGFFALISVLAVFLSSQDFFSLFKQALPIFLASLGTLTIMRLVGPIVCLRAYLVLALLACMFGFFQWGLSHFLSIDILLNTVGRLNSISTEPSHFAIIIAPAFFYFIAAKKVIKALIVGFALVLTFSATAFFLAILCVFAAFIIYRFLWLPVALFAGALLFLLAYFYVDEFSYRMTDLWMFAQFRDYVKVNPSTFSLMTNLELALFNLKSYPWGVGWGSHPWAYDNYLPLLYPETVEYRHYGINKYSAHSLLIRIISEMGIFAVILLVFFVFAGAKLLLIKKNDLAVREASLMGMVGFVYIIGRFYKLGGYFDFGLWVFIGFALYGCQAAFLANSNLTKTTSISSNKCSRKL